MAEQTAIIHSLLEQGIPNTSKTKFRIGSVTKSFTAAAVLLLVAQLYR